MTPCRLAVSLCVASAFVFASPIAAQEMKPVKAENVDYHKMLFLKFKPGKRERANDIIDTYFAPAGADAKLPKPVAYHSESGAWDFIVVFPMKGGPADMEWVTSPDDVAWWQAFSKRAGGEAEAKKIDAEFDSLIADRVTEVMHTHR